MFRFVAAAAITTVCGWCCPTAPNSTTAIAIKQAEVRELSDVRITFVEVRNDSRCPAEAMCVWIGNAEVAVSVQAPFTRMLATPVVLNTALEPRSMDFGATRITLDSLKPPARLNPPIAQSEYTAYFTVTRLQY